MKKLKNLEEYNIEQLQSYKFARKAIVPHPNGIECPVCKNELWDSKPMITLTSNPPQKNIHCPECGHRGYRIA